MNDDAQAQTPRLNYASIAVPISSAEVKAFKAQQPKGTYAFSAHFTVVLVVVFVVVYIVGMFVRSVAAEGGMGQGGILSMAVLLGALAGVTAYSINRTIVRHAKLARLARQNNITALIRQKNPDYNGMIFNKGRRMRVDEALQLPGVEVGNYRYTTGSGKSSQEHKLGYVKVKLGRMLPHMVLDARKNNFFGMTNLPEIFNASQTLQLEGDFNKYFNLYAPQNYARDALYIFTPDVMAAAIDSGKDYDMEIVDDELYIYQGSFFDLLRAGEVEKILDVAEKISTQVKGQSKRYADERVGDRSQNVVADPGQRLKRGTNRVLFGLIILAVSVQMLSGVWPEVKSVFYLVLFGLVVWLGVASLVKWTRRS